MNRCYSQTVVEGKTQLRCQLPRRHDGPHVAEGETYYQCPWRVSWGRWRGSRYMPLPPVEEVK